MERGIVKWFNQVSDYGFIVPDEGGPDRYMRGGNFAGPPSTLREGVRVAFEAREGGMGPEAIKVRRVAPIRRRSTGSFEPARRRGPFDPRFPRASATRDRATTTHRSPDDDGLGWRAFEARYFPDRNRHDLESLKAFESYGNASSRQIPRQQANVRPRGFHTPARSTTSKRKPGRSGYGRLHVTETPEQGRKAEHVTAPAVSDWEGEGGAMP